MDNSTHRVSWLTRWLWFCSGANPEILRQCPVSEHIKFAGVGATVLFTGLLATLSGGYAFYTVFQSLSPAVFFGLLWGLIIFNLDRFIVSTIKKEGSIGRQFILALPRFLLAVILAVVISMPLELRIFEAEIAEILTERQRDKVAAAAAANDEQLFRLEQNIAQLLAAIEASRQLREKDYQDYKCECDGTCGTGVRGRGSECERKEKKYLQSNAEYLQLSSANQRQIDLVNDEILQLKDRTRQAREMAKSTFATGLMARISASRDLPAGPSLFITLLILMIEISPILAKLLAPRGPYDEILRKTERQFYLEQLQELKEQQLSLSQRSELKAQLEGVDREHQVNQRKEALRAISAAKHELVQDQIDEWLEAERNRLQQEKQRSQDSAKN